MKKWAVQVTYPSGDQGHLRHGLRVGYGAIVGFRTRADAAVHLGVITHGMDAGTVATVVRYPSSDPRPPEAPQ